MTRPAGAHISLGNLRHNLARVIHAAPHSQVMAVIKANAYGHGLEQAAQALDAAHAFGVVGLEEAIRLREAGIERRIVLLEGLFSAEDVALVCGYRLDVVVHAPHQVELLERGRLTRPVDCWLKVDTGMHRLGFAPADVAAVAQRLRALPHAGVLRYLTHFARADEPAIAATRDQLQCFNRLTDGLAAQCSMANSAAILAWPDSHADWVRPGIMLYGSSPFADRHADELGLKPVMTLRSELIAVHERRRGDPVGYGGDWVCPADTRIGVVAMGYGDGYPRHAVSGTPVLVNGRRVTLAGRVSMDMLCVDLGGNSTAQPGDAVILWGDGLPVDEIAQQAGTIAYELLCGVNRRVCYSYHS
jgi:alanine racemase